MGFIPIKEQSDNKHTSANMFILFSELADE